MRAYEMSPGDGVGGIREVERPDPEPGHGEVLVRVRATSLNYRDLLMTRRRHLPPVVPLSDGAGEIVQVGTGVEGLAAGERVAGCFFTTWEDGEATPARVRGALGGDIDGMLAELVVLPASAVVRIPAYMTFEEAATLPCAAVTAWNAMFEATRQRPGATVLLLGTGGVSIFGLQFAGLAGLRSIITSSSDEKLARARELGATHTINYRAHDDWETRVRELTDGRGVDLVLEVGGAATLGRSIASTAMGGTIVTIGRLTQDAGAPASVLGHPVTTTRVYVGSRVMFERMNRALELHALHPVIDRVFPFDEAPEAYRYLESQAHLGKVVVSV